MRLQNAALFQTVMPAIPVALLVLSMLLASQWPLPFWGGAMPILPAYAMVYYWGLFRPRALPLWAIVLLALLHDVLYGLPLGVSLSQFVVILLVCGWLRRRVMLAHYLVMWLLLAPLMLALFLLLCCWQFWVSGIAMSLWMGAYDLPFFLSWLSYPLLGVLLNACYHQMRVE